MANIIQKLFGEKTKTETYSLMESGIEKFLRGDKSSHAYYDISPYFSKAIRKRAEKVAEVRWYLVDTKGEEIWDNEWLDLLNNPNNFYSGTQFWRLFQTHKDIFGEAYLWIERNGGKPKELHLLTPSKVKAIKGTEGKFSKVLRYEYNGVTFKAEDVLHDLNPNPLDMTKPEPIVNKGGLQVLKTEEYINSYHSQVIENGGTANKIISIKGEQNKERKQEEKDALEQKIRESSKTGKPVYFGGEVEIKDFGIKPNELDFLNTKKAILEDIAIITGVPASILSSYSDSKYSNAEIAIKNFLREYIRPEIKGLTDFLNQKLLPNELILSFIDPTPDNVEEGLSVLKTGSDIGALSTNEKRKMISKLDEDLSLEDVENGDEISNGREQIILNNE